MAEDGHKVSPSGILADDGQTTREGFGVALSGGGIRSAAFSLGALQVLSENRLFNTIDYLSCVSGGSYVPLGLLASAAENPAGRDREPWAQGSVEERFFRDNSRYLSPSTVDHAVFGANLLYGAVINYIPFAAAFGLIGRYAGVIDHSLWRPIGRGRVAVGLLAALGMSFLFLIAAGRFLDWPGVPRLSRLSGRLEGLQRRLVAISALALAVVVGLPAIAGLFEFSVKLIDRSYNPRTTGSFGLPPLSIVSLQATSLALLVATAGVLALAVRPTSPWRRRAVVVFGIAGSAALCLPILLAFPQASKVGFSSDVEIPGTLASLLALVIWDVLFHAVRHSPHPYYRRRLESVFCGAGSRINGGGRAERRRYRHEPATPTLWLSKCYSEIRARLPGYPKIIVCAAVNVARGESPPGRNCQSFVFAEDGCGNDTLGYLPVRELERPDGLGSSSLTVGALMAVSGAAVAPVMGRLTQVPLRFVMALLNLRLGVWIPSPNEKWVRQREGVASTRRVRRAALSQRGPATVSILRPILWFAERVRDGFHEPGALYIWREAVGAVRSDRPFVYVTDGGHFDNLGLVELVRRRCDKIICFDATSYTIDEREALAVSASLCRTELGVELIHQSTELVGSSKMLTFRLAGPGMSEGSRLVVARPVRPAADERGGASLDSEVSLAVEHALDARFPNHPTSLQLFGERDFEAYRVLGRLTAMAALDALNLPPAEGPPRPDPDGGALRAWSAGVGVADPTS